MKRKKSQWGGGKGRCERRSEASVKIQKKKYFFFLNFLFFFLFFFLGGGGGGGGSGRM